MDYIKIHWKHDVPEDPILFYLEVGTDRYDKRRVVVFINGELGYASENEEVKTGLSEVPIDSIDEISSDPECEAIEITKEEFEELWKKALAK
ncbi:hypothetical protein IC620_13180 [Hazenella sp. IB182357]|uniref:DUF6881 domain-containing protein n=1 Tax=Polycladospora coralii TaxID=2771432 RepID=A0A926N7E8_9BACL|nr:hypothetical protein [Polycladospora coralii]MBD1373301.1 hypothetical protein [Polycladospora coralii]MBS7528916.1 hypothetical protein [Polycladospora coralii]